MKKKLLTAIITMAILFIFTLIAWYYIKENKAQSNLQNNNQIASPNNVSLDEDVIVSGRLDQELVAEFIRNNITTLSPEEAVLGGTFYVSSLTFLDNDSVIVDYEDGHIALSAEANYQINDGQVMINSFIITTNEE